MANELPEEKDKPVIVSKTWRIDWDMKLLKWLKKLLGK